jgi:outer membrane receptor protein involved in Fe transport
MRIKAVCFVALLLLGLATSLPAQEITGNISGTITDPSGGGIPDANVVVTNTATAVERSTTTTSAGIFFFSNLPVGDYELAVSKPGFKKSETKGIHLNVNDKLAFPITMVLGAVNEVVTVTSEAAVLQTESAEVSNLVGNNQMKALPLNQRDFGQLVDLVPGVAPDNGRVGINDTSVSVNGNQSNSNLYLVDGTFDEDNGNNGGIMVRPSVDSIEEFKILRNNYSPEFGEATGAIVNVVTKSGGKDFHGSLFEFLRNDKLDASDPFLGAPGKLRYNDYGFTIGGPVWIPKVYNTEKKSDFFFFSTEFSREIRGNTVTGTVPTARQRTGTLDPNCAFALAHVPPLPCTPQAADTQEFVVDEQNFTGTPDPNAVAFLDRYPLPNTDISNGFNFIASSPAVSNFNHYAIRWDHQFGAKASLMANYMQTNTPLAGLNSNGFWGDDNFPSVNSDWNTKAKLANIKLTTVISSRTVNDFQFGYSNNVIDIKTSTVSDPVLASRSGFTYTELFPETSGSFPALNLNDGFDALQHTAPFFDLTHNFQYRDDLTHSFGKHNLKVGFFARFSRKLEPANGGGDFTAGSFNVLSLGDLLAGNASQYTEQESNNDVPSRGRDVALYFQDTFKVSSSFTLDYGLRWQYLGQVFSVENNVASFYPNRYDPARCPAATAFVVDPVTGGLVVDPGTCDTLNGIVTQKTPGVDKSLRDPHYRDFEPRVGFAWAPLPSKRLLLRVGGGIYHGRDAFSQNSATGQLPPFNNNPVLNGITFSSMTTPFDSATPQPPGALNVLEKSYPSPQSYQYSLGVQYELMPRTSLEVNYVGSRQIHLGRNRNINQVPATFQPAIANFVNNGCTPDPDPTTASTCVDPNTVRPFLGYDFINVNERQATSRYNSLQVFFNRQLSHGLAFQASYTYSRNIATTANRDSEARDLPMQDAFHPEREKAVAIQDIPHSLVFNYVWQLPFARKSNGILKVLAAGWQINGISTFRSGRPVNVCLQNDNAGLGDSGICERPDITGDPVLDKSKRTLSQWFNTSAFSVPTLGTFGNGGRNPVRGSGINNWDLSVFKVTDFPWFGRHSGWNTAETAKLEFRAEMFNVWNHPQFSDPGSTLGDADFGQITGLGINPREVQFGLRIEF